MPYSIQIKNLPYDAQIFMDKLLALNTINKELYEQYTTYFTLTEDGAELDGFRCSVYINTFKGKKPRRMVVYAEATITYYDHIDFSFMNDCLCGVIMLEDSQKYLDLEPFVHIVALFDPSIRGSAFKKIFKALTKANEKLTEKMDTFRSYKKRYIEYAAFLEKEGYEGRDTYAGLKIFESDFDDVDDCVKLHNTVTKNGYETDVLFWKDFEFMNVLEEYANSDTTLYG